MVAGATPSFGEVMGGMYGGAVSPLIRATREVFDPSVDRAHTTAHLILAVPDTITQVVGVTTEALAPALLGACRGLGNGHNPLTGVLRQLAPFTNNEARQNAGVNRLIGSAFAIALLGWAIEHVPEAVGRLGNIIVTNVQALGK